jgi:hypothetical protein
LFFKSVGTFFANVGEAIVDGVGTAIDVSGSFIVGIADGFAEAVSYGLTDQIKQGLNFQALPSPTAHRVGKIVGNVGAGIAGGIIGAGGAAGGGALALVTGGTSAVAGGAVAVAGGSVAVSGVVMAVKNASGGGSSSDEDDFESMLDSYDVDTNTYNWGDEDTLLRHFRKHGEDFKAVDQYDYARMANDFYNNRGKYKIKIDKNGTIRVYDRKTNTFGSYNADGTTRTFYQPEDGYKHFLRQPSVTGK